MDENNNMEGMDGMDEDVIVFEDEDGQEYEFTVVDYFFYNGDEYALLTENGTEGTDQEGECIVCKVVPTEGEDGEEDEEFELVEDEELAQKLIDIANTHMAEDEEEDE